MRMSQVVEQQLVELWSLTGESEKTALAVCH